MAVTLNSARAVALSALPPTGSMDSTALVPFDQVMALMKAKPPGGPTPAQQASERAFNNVVMHHVGTLAFRKRQRAILASLGAGLTAVLGLITAFAKFGYDTDTLRPMFGAFTAMAAIGSAGVALLAWRIASMERALKLDLEEAAETLSDRSAYLDVLDEIGLGTHWTRQELLGAVEEWEIPAVAPRRNGFLGPRYVAVPLALTAHEIGAVDFSRLLLAKGLELELIEERQALGQDGRPSFGFARRV